MRDARKNPKPKIQYPISGLWYPESVTSEQRIANSEQRKMQRLFLLILTMFFGGLSFSQETVPVSGWVRNAETGEPLPYAQISVAGTTLGTVTNEEGFFRLMLPDVEAKRRSRDFGTGLPDTGSPDSLVVMYLGFRTQRVAADQFKSGLIEISMEPVALDLREVEIIAFTPQEVLRRAFDSIPVNYGADSLILTAFIRTQKMVNNRMAEFTEAIVEDLKTGYSICSPRASGIGHPASGTRLQTSNIPYLFKGRVTSDTNLVNLLGEVGANARCLGCNFVRDIAEFPYETILDPGDQKHYLMTMKELSSPEGGKIYRIRFDQDDKTNQLLNQGEILIDARDFAILQITYKPSYKAFDAYEKSKYNRTWFLNNQPGWIQEMPLGETTVTYSKRGGYWTLSTIRQQYRVTYSQPDSRQKIVYGYKNEVVVTDVTRDPEQIRAFRGDKSVGVNQRWDQVVGEPDEAFWENYNYLPVEEELRKELNW